MVLLGWFLGNKTITPMIWSGVACWTAQLGCFEHLLRYPIVLWTPEAAWSAIGGDENADSSWEQSLWISWGLFFDPGTQTGGRFAAVANVRQTVCTFVFSSYQPMIFG